MSEQLLKKVIKIITAETKQMSNGGYMTKIKDENGLSYTLFHLKADKTESKAFAVFKTLPVSGIGSMVEITFKEDLFTKDGKEYKSRKVVLINPEAVAKDEVPASPIQENGEIKVSAIPF